MRGPGLRWIMGKRNKKEDDKPKAATDRKDRKPKYAGICLDASFTVEAAFVVPIIIFSIIGIIWIVLFLHDQVCAQADYDMCFFEMEREAAENTKKKTYNKDIGNTLKTYRGGKVKEASLKRDGSVMNVRLEVSENLPSEGFLGALMKSFSGIKMEGSRKMADRTETARLIKASSEIIDEIVGAIKKKKGKG